MRTLSYIYLYIYHILLSISLLFAFERKEFVWPYFAHSTDNVAENISLRKIFLADLMKHFRSQFIMCPVMLCVWCAHRVCSKTFL